MILKEFSGKPSFCELEKSFHAELTTNYRKGVHQSLFCQIQAPGLFQEVYGSMLKGKKNNINKKTKTKQNKKK